jgi:glycosyltransferase involved in cell wall biosynthesis
VLSLTSVATPTDVPRPPPLVSCIVPVFNGALYLRDALDSALRQTYAALEVIAVDDGSTDGTPDILRAYGARVRVIRQENAGPATARNAGIRAARGEFVSFLDADDVLDADKLSRQIARFAARPELDISVTHVRNFWIPELREEEARFREHRMARAVPGYLASTMVARRGVFAVVGEFDASRRFADSTDWFLRAAQHGTVVEALPDVLYFRRIHHGNRSRRWSAASRDEFFGLVKAHLDRRRGADRPPASPAERKQGSGR